MRQGFLFAEPPSRGCPPSIIDNMEVVKFEPHLFDDSTHPSECCICMGDFNDEEIILKTKCSHVFHKDCLKSWLVSIERCPICREYLNEPSQSSIASDDEHIALTV